MYIYICIHNVYIHVCIFVYIYIYIYMYVYTCTSVLLISSYGAPLAQRASYLALHSSLWASGTVNYDHIVTNSINS